MNYPYRAAIFDLDGTLIDSMPYWKNLLSDYLAQKGLECDSESQKEMETLTLTQGAFYIKSHFYLEETVPEIQKGLRKAVEEIYTQNCQLKPGVAEVLAWLKARKIPMGIATITNKKAAKKALKRLGVHKFFRCVMTDVDVGKGKSSPDLYLAVAKKLRTAPRDCAVWEDSLRYGKVAKAAGFGLIAAPDEGNARVWTEFCALADGVAPWCDYAH